MQEHAKSLDLLACGEHVKLFFLLLSLGFVDIAHVDGVRFGAQLYAVNDGDCAIALNLGLCLDVINDYTPPTLPEPPSTVDPTNRE